MSTLFLFGAGASAFSGECYPQNPPLGNTLFAELRASGGIAADIEEDIARRFNDNFESGMAEFSTRRRSDVPAFLRQMSAYFARFGPGRANIYIDLLLLLLTSRKQFTLATLNYDLLIERAITIIGNKISYQLPPVPARNVPLLKLHGSCNFLPDLGGVKISDVSFDFPGAQDTLVDSNVRIAQPSEVIDFCNRETSLAPSVALYAAGKQILFCPRFVLRQQREWATAVATATRIYLVGVRVNPADEHIWSPLQLTRAKVFYVGPDGGDFSSWATSMRKRASFHLAPSFEALLPIMHRHLKMH